MAKRRALAGLVAPGQLALFGGPPPAEGPSGADFTPDRRYRRSLWRTLDRALGQPAAPGTAVFLGFNPSTGDEREDDLSITKSLEYTRRLAVARSLPLGRVRWVNPFALVSSDPRALLEANDPIGPGNEEALDRAFAEAAVVVAVCGSLAEGMPRPFRDYAVAHVREVLRRAIVRAPAVVCLGVGRGGGPRHLARLGYDTPFEDFTLAAAPARPTRRKESP